MSGWVATRRRVGRRCLHATRAASATCFACCACSFNLLVVERLAFDISAFQNFAARAGMQQAVAGGGAAAAGSASRASGKEAQDVLLGAATPHPLLGLPQQFAEPEQLFRLLLSAEVRKTAGTTWALV